MSDPVAARQRRMLLNIRSMMLRRCNDPTHSAYPYYGGRGIKVCDRWTESAQAFLDDVSPRPPGLTLDRPKNDEGYGPDNFKWATRAEQVRNRRCSIYVEVAGERMVLKDACARLALSYDAIQPRMKRLGWSFEKAISTPIKDVHRAARAMDECGRPNWRRCQYCKQYDDTARLDIDAHHNIYHRACRNAHYRAVYAQKKGK
jgi:hypothetical protein